MVTIYYNRDALILNAPHGTNPYTSIEALIGLARRAIEQDGYEVEFKESENDRAATWIISGVFDADTWAEIYHELRLAAEGSDWYDYTKEEQDYEYGV